MSSQPPFDPSYQPPPFGQPGRLGPAAPSEYIPLDAPPVAVQPMPRPAYLYPLLYTPVPGAHLTAASQERWPSRILALAGLLLGLVGMILWLLPGLGALVSLLGLAFSILGWRRPTYRWMAILSCALSAAVLVLSIYNSALGSHVFPH